MPVRNAETREWVREGKLVVLGIAQEHHRDRCRLFAQWRELDWPIVGDPINVMQVKGVPIEVAVDEYGIVRSVKPNMKTSEARQLEFEVYVPAGAQGVSDLKAYALYYVCEGVDGVCYYLRQNIGVTITVD